MYICTSSMQVESVKHAFLGTPNAFRVEDLSEVLKAAEKENLHACLYTKQHSQLLLRLVLCEVHQRQFCLHII